MRWFMPPKFRLSTLFLLALVVAVSLGWFVDHYDRSRRELVGSWVSPVEKIFILNGETKLEIRNDGTFTHYDYGRWGRGPIFKGTYTCRDDGEVVFHITGYAMKAYDEPSPKKWRPLDTYHYCRCAIDKSKCLIIHKTYSGLDKNAQDAPVLQWGVYKRDSS